MKLASKTALRRTAQFCPTFHLPFLDYVHKLDTGQNDAREVEVLEPEHRSGSAFDGPTVLLDDVGCCKSVAIILQPSAFSSACLPRVPKCRKIVIDQLCRYPAAKAEVPELTNVKHVFVRAVPG
jgi:hypothetical protein